MEKKSTVPVGRGRGHVNLDRKEQLRRPEQKYVSPLDGIATKIMSLNTHMKEDLESIHEDIGKYCNNDGKLIILINDLHERSLVSRPFGVKCAVALATQCQLVVEDKKLRDILMHNVQNDYLGKEDLKRNDPNRFMNTVAFLGNIFRHFRLANNSPIDILGGALLDYFKMLISGSELELELAVQQLALNGKLLNQVRSQQLRELQVTIRSASMAPGVDAKCLAWLHLACDLHGSNYAPLSVELKALYESALGKGAMAIINSQLTASDPIFLDNSDSATAVTMLNGLNVNKETPPVSPEPISPPPPLRNNHPAKSSNDYAKSRNYGEDRRARDTRQVRPKEYPRESTAHDREVWGLETKSQSSRSVWGHDDRFDKEDGYYAKKKGSMGTKEGDRYGRRNFQDAASKPLPNTDSSETWD